MSKMIEYMTYPLMINCLVFVSTPDVVINGDIYFPDKYLSIRVDLPGPVDLDPRRRGGNQGWRR